MTKHLILYYSKSGNSKFIAEKLNENLHGHIITIKPMFDNPVFQILISFMNIPIPVNITGDQISRFQEVIIIGPVWVGRLVSPLRTVLRKCVKLEKPIHFAVTCESKDTDKNNKFGYNHVFNKAKSIAGPYLKSTTAFSTSLTTDYDEKSKADSMARAKITEENFSDELKIRLDDLNDKIFSNEFHISDGTP